MTSTRDRSAAYSSGTNVRPSTGCVPTTLKNSGPTTPIRRASALPPLVSVNWRNEYAAIPSNDWLSRCQSRKFAGDNEKVAIPGNVDCGGIWNGRTSRSGSLNGSGRSSTALTMLKMAVLAPMPSARTAATANAYDGVRTNTRSAWRTSDRTVRMNGSLPCVWTNMDGGFGGDGAQRTAGRQNQRRADAGDATARARNS